MRESGNRTRLMGRGNFIMLTEIFLKENGNSTKLTVLEPIYMLMEQNMKANGKMIYNMDMG